MEEEFITGQTDTEKVIRGYLSKPNADKAMVILNLLEQIGFNDVGGELEPYIYKPADIIDDGERALSIMDILNRNGLQLLNTLGVYFLEDNMLPFSLTATLLNTLSTVDELDITDVLFLSAARDEASDIDYIILLLSLDVTVDAAEFSNYIKDVSPTLIESINKTLDKALSTSAIEPIDLKNDNVKVSVNILDNLSHNLPMATPDVIVHSLLNKSYVNGLNDTFVNDLIKTVPLNTERYEGDTLYKYLLTVVTELLFIHTINDEDDVLLTSLSQVQEYVEPTSLPKLNRDLIFINKILTDSGLFKYIGDVHE